jgi:diguanylate cyclase (GGDEF)-like protein
MLLALYTVLTVANSLLYRGVRGIHWFSLYNLFALLGAISVALRGDIPDFLSIVVGNVFVVVAYFLLYLSLSALFGGKRQTIWLHAGLVFAGVATNLQWGLFTPNTTLRLLAYSIVLGLQQTLIAGFILRRNDRALRKACAALAIMLAALALTNLVRILGVSQQGAPNDYLQAGAFLAWIVMINSCLQCGVIVAYVWMSAALLRNELEIQAMTDPLTGLLNRRAIERAAEREIALCAQVAAPLCAIILDLDNFKTINDSLGHSRGDALLTAVAAALQRGVRPTDVLARMGGDEFAIVLPFTAVEAALTLAESLRRAIHAIDLGEGAAVTASFGIAEADPATRSWDRLVLQCDQALYASKRSGGNLASSPLSATSR